MDVVKELTKVGKDLGLEGEALNTFVSEQQVILRDERQAARDAERERREAEREIREMEVRAERERHERELKAKADEQEKQREIKEYELQLKKQEIELKRNELLAQEAEKVRQKELKEQELETQRALKERELEVQYEHANEEMELKADEERKIRIADRAKYEAEIALRQQEIALERERLVAEREKLEREYEMQIELQDRRHFAEMERITAQRAERPIPAPRDTIKARTPKIPAFNEGKDEMDAYLLRFERYASAQGWKRETWATDLSALLQGKALDVYALMPQEDAMDYDKLKCALLQRYQLTEEGFKRKYRKCRPEIGETFQQFSARLKSYFTRWIDMSGIPKTFEGLQDLMLRDQFTFICNRELELFLREREPTSLEQASKLADSYKEARYVDIVNLTFKNDRGRSRSNSASRSRSPVKRDQIPNNQNSYGRGRGKYYPGLKCYNCGGTHYRRECPELKPGIMKVGAVGHRGRSPTKKVTFQSKDSEVQTTYEDSHEDTTTDVKKCGACLTYTNTVSYSKAAMESKDNLHEKHQVSVSSVSSLSELSTVQGMVEEKSVEVLRDTGCSGVIVSKHVVPEGAYTGRNQTMVMVDYSTRVVPEVKVNIDTPYYKGEVLALCVEKPLVDLIIGNIPGARERNKPDIDWVPTLAVQTRAQKKQEGTHVSMKTPEIVIQEVTPDQIRKAQNEDQSLKVMKARCEAKECLKNASYFIKNNLMYRKFSSPNIERGRLFTQLIVPQQFRKTVMKLAHESIMAGHLAVKRTIQKVLSEFYWPGISSDIKRFCQSCDICQRTVPKGKIIRAPLGNMPRIDVPFKRVATDLIGPLKPVTYSKNRFILTVVDYATRYPEAVPLASIDTETVAEALVSIFSRVGVPSEILSDLGSQYTSSIMKEVSRLLSFKQLVTTPYHPICNGLVERFNQTIKKMLMRMCAERPKDWDKYIDPLLFAYRETPQESLGFSPFELLYGWPVRGPMQILRQLWSKEIQDQSLRSTYQYVIELRERLETTLAIAQDNLSKMSRKYKRHYDRKAGKRTLKVGDKALVLLPTDNNKLLMAWKGPYDVVEKLSPLDYKIRVGKKDKLFHINMLKQYVVRQDGNVECQARDESQVCAVSLIDLTVENMDDESRGGLVETPSGQNEGDVLQVNINPALNPKERKQVEELIQEFPETFSEKPGRTTLMEHDIKLTTDTPVRVKQYPLPYSMMEAVGDEVRNMLELKVIERSESPYCSPIVIVKKKDNSNRFCIDFRVLNKITVFDAEPMPSMEQIFSKLAGYKWITKMDLSKGYWQIPLSDRSKQYTAFQTPLGLFQFTVLPFGLVTAQASCSRLMRKLLQNLSNIDNFVDDIIIFTMTWEQHLDVLRSLLSRLREANLTVKPCKCFVGYSSIECLGHMVSQNTLQPCEEKIVAIQNAVRPTTKKQLRSFLGLVGFYRSFIEHFSEIAAPLTELTRKGQKNHEIQWGEPQEQAFNQLRKALVNQPILKMADVSQAFTLQVDASDVGLGAVLLQEENGKKIPVAYASRKLKPSEKAYAVVEKECLALVWAVQKFSRYLYGTDFIVETDHCPLKYLNEAKLKNSRLMRWALILQPYRMHINAIKGSENVGADYLSRI